jgi:hypothetical protein
MITHLRNLILIFANCACLSSAFCQENLGIESLNINKENFEVFFKSVNSELNSSSATFVLKSNDLKKCPKNSNCYVSSFVKKSDGLSYIFINVRSRDVTENGKSILLLVVVPDNADNSLKKLISSNEIPVTENKISENIAASGTRNYRIYTITNVAVE